MIDVPSAFAADTIAREGASGEAWIRSLPARVDALCRRWALRPSGRPMHGYLGIVVPVQRADARFALKVSWIDEYSYQEAVALRAWGGRGAVALEDAAEDEGALLLEWLDPGRSLVEVAEDEAVTRASELLRRLAIPAPAELRTLGVEVASLIEALRRRVATGESGVPPAWVDWAAEWTRDAPMDAPTLVNQDLHYENVLAGRREPWLVIDPKPLRGVVEFGVAPLLWNRMDSMGSAFDLERRLSRICGAGALDHARARGWSAFRLIEAAVWAGEQADADFAARCRTLVTWLFDAGMP